MLLWRSGVCMLRAPGLALMHAALAIIVGLMLGAFYYHSRCGRDLSAELIQRTLYNYQQYINNT